MAITDEPFSDLILFHFVSPTLILGPLEAAIFKWK